MEDEEVLTDLVVFSTRDQTTRLKITDRGLECDLQTLPEDFKNQWKLSKDAVAGILKTGSYKVQTNFKGYTGLF